MHPLQIHEELLLASQGMIAVEGYIVVACFLVREGADWHIKNHNAVSPHEMLSPAVVDLITDYMKKQ